MHFISLWWLEVSVINPISDPRNIQEMLQTHSEAEPLISKSSDSKDRKPASVISEAIASSPQWFHGGRVSIRTLAVHNPSDYETRLRGSPKAHLFKWKLPLCLSPSTLAFHLPLLNSLLGAKKLLTKVGS